MDEVVSLLLSSVWHHLCGAAVRGEEALAFGAVRGKGLEDDSAGCVMSVGVELGHSWMGACTCNVSA